MKLARQLQKKVHFTPRFLIILILIVIISFFLIRFIAEEITNSIQKDRYKVNTIDEQVIYKGTTHDIKDDVILLEKSTK